MSPNPEEFAKLTIWNLACIRAELEKVNTKLDFLAGHSGLSFELGEHGKEAVKQIQRSYFLQGLKVVGIEPGEGWPPE